MAMVNSELQSTTEATSSGVDDQSRFLVIEDKVRSKSDFHDEISRLLNLKIGMGEIWMHSTMYFEVGAAKWSHLIKFLFGKDTSRRS